MRVIDVNRKKYQMIVELYLRVLWGGRILFKKKKATNLKITKGREAMIWSD